MIKINLLKSEQPRARMNGLVEPRGGSKKNAVVVAGLLALIAVAGYFAYQQVAGKPDAEAMVMAEVAPVIPDLAETPPEPPPSMAAAPASGEAVEDIVGELARSAEAAPKPRGYADLVPSERIDYQLQAVQRILKEIKAITPADVGFAQFIFTPPGEFYVHGLAYSAESLERFQAGLQGLQGAEVRQGKRAEVGSASQKAREFSFYCKVSYPVAGMHAAANRVVAHGKVDGALRDAVTLANGLGLKLRAPKLTGSGESGGLKRLVFTTETRASYDKLQDFLEQLRASQAPLGVLRVSLQARGDEDMVADLDLVAYVGGRPGG